MKSITLSTICYSPCITLELNYFLLHPPQIVTLVREMLDECDLPGENIRVGLKTAELLFKEKVSYRERTTKRDQARAID